MGGARFAPDLRALFRVRWNEAAAIRPTAHIKRDATMDDSDDQKMRGSAAGSGGHYGYHGHHHHGGGATVGLNDVCPPSAPMAQI